MIKASSLIWVCWAMIIIMVVVIGSRKVDAGNNVSYDGRALIINGQRKILFSGSIHYPRSTPQMWPSLISKAKDGGIDVIQTYVFWNQHEPQPGQYNFEGNLDLVQFMKEIQAQGLYATLRIGPFIEAEWTYGGLPLWLLDVPGIVYRSDNEPFKHYMQNFTTKIVTLMKSESLYASQGGPIILSQIENEYQNVEAAFHANGPPYVRWAAQMAVNQQTGVPWAMCKQTDAPDPVINACNGRTCGETFTGPNSPNKPAIWTENWTSFLSGFGQDPTKAPIVRSAEDIAYHVALILANKTGSYVNYYMYHGGTNFGRTGSAYMTTNYYDEAPLDEYGLLRQPKYGHLKELHAAVKLISEPLLQGTVTNTSLGQNQIAFVFQEKSGNCAAFLINKNGGRHDATLNFQNASYQLPPFSISILLNCKNEIFNTAKVSTQFSTRSVGTSEKLDGAERWQTYKEAIPNYADTPLKENTLLEHMNTTKDVSDYLWYTFSFDYKPTNAQPVLDVLTFAHVVHAFVNDKYVGNAHGDLSKKNFTFQQSVSLNNGTNNISLLSVMHGLPDSGAFLEKRFAGVRKITIHDAGAKSPYFGGTNSMGYQVGLLGENLQIYSNEGMNKVQWSNILSSAPLTWYQTTFDAPQGDVPVVLNLSSMGKGQAWVNGQSIGRYWSSFNASTGTPSQTIYHIPRAFLKPTGNLLVLMEELSGNPLTISVGTVSNNKACSRISDSHLPPVSSWELITRTGGSRQTYTARRPRVQLDCPSGMTISKILFASYGNPLGDCSNYAIGSCHASNSRAVVERICLGKSHCSITQSSRSFGGDPCPGVSKTLLVDAQCG
ncbi:hypothetical protein ACHQM5_022873 [Ranunculus cassubicifolius]